MVEVVLWHILWFCLQIKKLSDEFQEEMKKISETQEHLLSVFKHYHKVSSDNSGTNVSSVLRLEVVSSLALSFMPQ